MVAQNLFFYGIALVIVYSGFRVVTSDNVVHAALHLVAVLASPRTANVNGSNFVIDGGLIKTT